LDVDSRNKILFDGERVGSGPEVRVVYALNKPPGVVSTAADTHGRPTVVEMVRSGAASSRRLYPVGRLDVDSTGLILLTDDGDLAHKLTHPSFEVPKRYIARVSGGALSERALTLNWCAPELVNTPGISITQGRHPVVESRLAETGGSFIANDTQLGPTQRMQIITGPNMGGKSTYMRQVALIVLLASIGSHVPASACRLGPIDAVHTRIGAADDLANAQSTFMLEMTEGAQILNNATIQSLVLMDEIGRGTSTFDGLALASGIATYLHDKTQAYSLFATHYFELTEFAASHRAAVNVHVSAAESGNDVVFLHEIQPGPASKSYGIQVARLAGMPSGVLSHAKHALAALESQAQGSRAQVDLFAEPPDNLDSGPSPLQAALNNLDPDSLTPREALDALYALKKFT
jgi:DNA mismatch repair protein MutS